MNKKVKITPKTIKREWHLIDAKDHILGRMTSEIAKILMGKNKPYYVPYLDCGDYVVVINAKDVRVTGRKEKQKEYLRYSGYPGGLKRETFGHLRERKPREIIRRAVWGMLPKNRLAREMIKKLHVFPDDNHPFKNRFEVKN